jgi:hypothetical protein
LIFALIGALYKIRALKEILAKEKRKQNMPLLTLEVNTERDRGVYLINDSYCYARNIRFNDLDLVVDYGFKKHLTLKFPPIDMLKPNAKIKLDYRVFDEKYDITSEDSLNILNHFSDAPIKMRLCYENIEGDPFTAILSPQRGRYVTKEITPLR